MRIFLTIYSIYVWYDGVMDDADRELLIRYWCDQADPPLEKRERRPSNVDTMKNLPIFKKLEESLKEKSQETIDKSKTSSDDLDWETC